jgi:hypothetical protein
LGALFKSRNETKSKSELFVIVTPEIVDPLNPGELKPELNFPKDWIDPLPARPQPKKQGENITPGSNRLASIPAEQQVIVAKLPAARPQEVPRPADAGVPAAMALTAPTPAPSPAPIPAIPAADPPPGAAAALIETASPPARTENISPAEGPAEPGALAPAAASAPPASEPVPLAQAVR